MKDYRIGKKVVLTLEVEDLGQDPIELDVLENGVLLGDSMMFKNGRISLVGIGAKDGMPYFDRDEILKTRVRDLKLEWLYVYMKETDEKDPLPWNASTFKYAITKVKKPVMPNRFLNPKSATRK